MMAPNQWNPSTKTLTRPLRLHDSSTSILVSISQPTTSTSSISLLHVHVHLFHHDHNLSSLDQDAILAQVRRMLRISDKDEEDVRKFHQLHPKAKSKGFGRIFRSPTLFEDIVKSILLCACPWRRSLEFAQSLCDLQYKTMGNNLSSTQQGRGNFPNEKEIASLDVDILKRHCNLGYRAKYILEFARLVESGQLSLTLPHELSSSSNHSFNNNNINAGKLMLSELRRLKGFGPFVSANILMCIGLYHKIPADSETFRHLREVHQMKNCNYPRSIERLYNKYEPFQCLAYWMELKEYYETRFGKLSELPPSQYYTITGSATHVNNNNNNTPAAAAGTKRKSRLLATKNNKKKKKKTTTTRNKIN